MELLEERAGRAGGAQIRSGGRPDAAENGDVHELNPDGGDADGGAPRMSGPHALQKLESQPGSQDGVEELLVDADGQQEKADSVGSEERNARSAPKPGSSQDHDRRVPPNSHDNGNRKMDASPRGSDESPANHARAQKRAHESGKKRQGSPSKKSQKGPKSSKGSPSKYGSPNIYGLRGKRNGLKYDNLTYLGSRRYYEIIR